MSVLVEIIPDSDMPIQIISYFSIDFENDCQSGSQNDPSLIPRKEFPFTGP
jgi:hypothetical protein